MIDRDNNRNINNMSKKAQHNRAAIMRDMDDLCAELMRLEVDSDVKGAKAIVGNTLFLFETTTSISHGELSLQDQEGIQNDQCIGTLSCLTMGRRSTVTVKALF